MTPDEAGTAYDDGLERRRCQACGRLFVAGFDWVKDCRLCYFEREGDLNMAFAEKAWAQGYELGLKRADRHSIETALGELPLQELLILCHPDHQPPERFEQANEITIWLLTLRDTRP